VFNQHLNCIFQAVYHQASLLLICLAVV